MSRAVLARDTTPAAEQVQVRIWRSMSPQQKAQLTSAATRGARELTLAGLRIRYPGASPRELKIRLARLILGADLAHRAYTDSVELLGS